MYWELLESIIQRSSVVWRHFQLIKYRKAQNVWLAFSGWIILPAKRNPAQFNLTLTFSIGYSSAIIYSRFRVTIYANLRIRMPEMQGHFQLPVKAN